MKLMDGIWGQGRARGYGVTALMAVVVLGASVTARDALTSPASDEQPAGTVYETPTPAPSPTTPQEPAPQPVAPVVVAPDAPAAVTQAPTVQTVTEPQPQQAAAPTVGEQPVPAKPYDPAAPWVDPASGKTFVPAPVPTMEKLPGEGEAQPATN